MFRSPSLIQMNIIAGFKTAKLMRGLRTISGNIPNTIDDLPGGLVISRLEKFLQKNPKDWFTMYLLGDWYIRDKQYVKSIEVLERAFCLRPKDIRSTFALATAYRHLSRAQFIGVPKELLFEGVPKYFIEEFDPETSQMELLKLGKTVDEVALKAMLLFEETLRLGVRKDEKNIVIESLQKMYVEFPHLELQVKNQICPKLNLTKKAREGSGNIFYDALGHYYRLRFLVNMQPRYRYELGEVIRLCQWAITTDKRDGDSYVLLANAYSLLDTCLIIQSPDPEYYLRWAGGIIQYWIDSPIHNFPHTKNIDLGMNLYESIVNQFIQSHHASRDTIIPLMVTLKEDFLNNAISPASYENTKFQLGG